MYTADATTIAYLASTTRQYDLRIGIVDGGTTYVTQDSGNIFPLSWDGNIQHSDFFTLGAITANGMKIELSSSVTVPDNGQIDLEVRLGGSSGYGDWIPMGTYYVDKRYENGLNTIVYECYDAVLYADVEYVSTLSFPASIQDIWDDAASIAGIASDAVLDTGTIDDEPTGYSCRVVMGYLASMCGGHLITNRGGNYDLVKPYANTTSSLTVATNMRTTFERIDDATKTISKVTCQFSTSDQDTVSIGDDTGYELVFYCPFITSTADLQDVFDMYDGFTFVPYTALQWIGDPRIDLGDHIQVVDNEDGVTTYDCYVVTQESSYGGGLSMFGSSRVKASTDSEFPEVIDFATAIQDRATFYDMLTEGRVQINGANVIAGTLAAESIVSDKGYIAELTVDQLSTEDKVQNYLASDTSDVNYIKIYEQYLEFITATTDGLSIVQAQDRNANLLYWTDATNTISSTQVTAYPVYIYDYVELEKMQLAFEDVDGVNTPIMILGAGTGVDDNGKGYFYKGVNGLEVRYLSSTDGSERSQVHSDDDVNHVIGDNIATNQFVIDEVTLPTDLPNNSTAIATLDYSNGDTQKHTTSATIDLMDGYTLYGEGTITLTLPDITTLMAGTDPLITDASVTVRVVNRGTGVLTITSTSGTDLFNGSTSFTLDNQYDMATMTIHRDDTEWNVESVGGTIGDYYTKTEIDGIIGDRDYTEENYVIDGEDLTSSVDALDIQAKLNADDITDLENDKADKTNVLELDNTTAFTPDTDYEPATKKYVDDVAGFDIIYGGAASTIHTQVYGGGGASTTYSTIIDGGI